MRLLGLDAAEAGHGYVGCKGVYHMPLQPLTLVAAGGVEIRKLGLHLHLIAQKHSGIHTGKYQDKPLCRQRDGK